ncbi:MAG: hypothetical protein Q7R64_04460 [bacterium]|nr:hypothetical protein [bacterium]
MNPHRHSQIERALHILDKSGTVAILKDDQYRLFIFKKTERIVSALYVITGLFSDSEPLRWAIRESGVLLIGHALSFKERATVQSMELISDTGAELAHLISLIDIAYVSDLLSPMNFSILKKELEAVWVALEGKWHGHNTILSQPSLDEHFFGLSKELFPEREREVSSLAVSSAYKERPATLQSFSDLERLKRNQKDNAKGHFSTKYNVLNEKSDISSREGRTGVSNRQSVESGSSYIKEERMKRIISVLRERNVAMIKDFGVVIEGCSEKTIQRLLIEMVRSGVLKREGDRRWSRYSLTEKK